MFSLGWFGGQCLAFAGGSLIASGDWIAGVALGVGGMLISMGVAASEKPAGDTDA